MGSVKVWLGRMVVRAAAKESIFVAAEGTRRG